MKRFLLLLVMGTIILASISINEAFAQRVVKKFNYAITGNPIALAFGKFPFSLEYDLNNENSITAGLRYSNYSGWSGIGITASYRWYVFQEQYKMLKGLSFGPLVTLDFLSYETASFKNGTPLGVGGEFAYKWIFDGFVVEPIIQVHFSVISFDGSEKYRPFGLGINVGYAW